MTLTFISHDSCPQETHPLRNWIQSSWTFSKSASYQLPREAHVSLTQSKVRTRHYKATSGRISTPWECCDSGYSRARIQHREGAMGNEVKKNAWEPWNRTPFWNLDWALEFGYHPLAYLQSPVSNRWRPPLSSFRSCSSGHTDPEQPGAWVLQSALLERFSRLVTKREKGTETHSQDAD